MMNATILSGTDLVRADTGEVLGVTAFSMPDYLASVSTPGALKIQQQLATAYDQACLSLIGPNDVQQEGNRSFKKKSAWRKLARHFSISTEVVRVEREMIDGVFLATAVVRARGPWGQSAESIGACGQDEATGRRTITLADAMATAETRATNRAVSNLIAMGEVSAEEMPSDPSVLRTTEGSTQTPEEGPACPKCGGRMWDNRPGKKNPKAPDYKCRRRTCEGVIWPPKEPDTGQGEMLPADPTQHGYLDALAAG
jgi:hypothetical protein